MLQPAYQILNLLADGVLIVDRDHTIVFANPAIGVLYGADPTEIVGRKCYEISHNRPQPCDRSCLEGSGCSHADVFRTGRPLTLKHRHVLSDGTSRVFEVTTSPITDKKGDILRMIQLVRNISQQEEWRERAETSHRELQMIFDNAPFTISFVDREMRVVRLNPAMEAQIAMHSGEVVGRYCYDCWGQYAQDITRNGREKICDACKVQQVLVRGKRYSYVKKIGSRIKEILSSPVRDRHGTVVGAMEIGRDITEQFLAEEALRKSEERYRTILDSSPDAIFVTDHDARFLDANNRASLLLGYSKEELLQMGIGDLDPAFSLERHRENIWGWLGRNATVTIERQLQRKDGHCVPVEIHIGWLEAGGAPAILNIVRDISERRRAEQALRESEERYRVLFANSPNVLCIGDFSGIRQYLATLPLPAVEDCGAFFKAHPQELANCLEHLRIVEVNQAALHLFGAASLAELTERLFTVIGSESMPSAIDSICAVAQGRSSFAHEIVLNHLVTGEKIYGITRWKVSPGHENDYQRVIISFVDISERKEIEDAMARNLQQLRHLSLQLVETEEAERRRIARELHDSIGQQLTALGINLHILRRDSPVGTGIDQSKRFADSLGLVEEMTQLVRDIMADLRPPVLDDYGLSSALRWYAELFSRRTGIRAEVTGTALPRLAPSMEIALFRVAQEALTNVAKHSGASEVRIHGHANEQGIVLVISDNGKGFSSGMGFAGAAPGRMGLISMRERVQALGGIFTVDGEPGGGVRIVVEVAV